MNKYYPTVWILWGADKSVGGDSFIEDVFAHKIMAEKVMRECKDSDPNSHYHYWIQEKEVNHEQTY